MLSIQQLIKALRKLQNTNCSVGAGDLVKNLKQVAAAATPSATSMSPSAVSMTSTDVVMPIEQCEKVAIMMTLMHDFVESSSTICPSSSRMHITFNTANRMTTTPKQHYDDDKQIGCQIQQLLPSTTPSAPSLSNSRVDSQTNHNVIDSLISHLYENSSTVSTTTAASSRTEPLLESVNKSQTQDSSRKTKEISYNCIQQQQQRSQQIQNFYQQQLHRFHTQHNQSLYTKQKQIQFAMSSLAAKPIASLKQQDDDLHLKQTSAAAVVAAAAASVITSDEIKDNDGVAGGIDATAKLTAATTSSISSGKPCFNTGLGEILQFMELIGNLKHTKRTGWVLRDVDDCESISGHMYRMSMMTFLLDGTEGLNQIRCMELALVHDLAESLVGDITPFCGVSKTDKRAMEFKAMEDICKLIEPRGKRIMELFEEYEHGESAESRFVKDLDRLDMVMQAFEYEKRDNCLLKHQEFFDSTEGKFNHPFIKKLVNEIYEQRKSLAKAKGATPPPPVHVPCMEDHGNGNNGAATSSSSSSSSSSKVALATNGHCPCETTTTTSSSS